MWFQLGGTNGKHAVLASFHSEAQVEAVVKGLPDDDGNGLNVSNKSICINISN